MALWPQLSKKVTTVADIFVKGFSWMSESEYTWDMMKGYETLQGLVSRFIGISTFVGYLMPKPSL